MLTPAPSDTVTSVASGPGVLDSPESGARKSDPTLSHDFSWTFLGNGIYAACQYAIVIVLAKEGSPELVGGYSYAVAIATPIITFATLQLRSVQVSDSKEEYPFSAYFGFRLWTMLLALVSIALLCGGLHYSWSKTALIGTIAFALAVEAVSDILYGQMQLRKRMDCIAKSMIARGLFSIGVLSVAMVTTRNLVASILAMVVARLLVTAFYDLRVTQWETNVSGRKKGNSGFPKFEITTQRKLLTLAFPVGLVSVLVALNTSIPRYFIEGSLGSRELGLFSALTLFQSSGNLIVGALGQAAFSRLAGCFADANIEGFVRMLGRLLLMGVVLGVAGVLVSVTLAHQILSLLFRPEYAAQSKFLTFLMVAAGMGYLCQLVGYGVTAARIFKPQIPLFLAVALTLLAASYYFVPRTGIAGAITAILIAAVVQLIGSFLLLWLSLRRKRAHRDWQPNSELFAS